ncbi:MAG: hypothetical protein ACK4RZ_10695 [Paracoccaceae bacterium]
MKSLLLLFLLALGVGPGQAQSVSVKSGDHVAFTRLVLTYPKPIDWILGRNNTGYSLKIKKKSWTYDLSSVFQLIQKNRLRSIWVDPKTGDLQFGIDCLCHAIPFELDARTLVIDIKDGPAPQNSSFELSLIDGSAVAPIAPAQTIRPRTKARNGWSYDWLAQETMPPTQRQNSGTISVESMVQRPPDSHLQRDAFRRMLVEEVGRGATAGVVTAHLPNAFEKRRPEDGPLPPPPKQARATLGEPPGISVTLQSDQAPDLTVKGDVCPKGADLDLSLWSDGDDAGTKLSSARADLLSEFDIPDTMKVLGAINTYLYYGFGAEARLLMSGFMSRGQQNAALLGLSYLVEGDHPPENPFLNMQSCDSSVALWSLLAAGPDEPLSNVNGSAVSRTFLSLPQHLRTVLGPEVAFRLLKTGDSANAEVVKRSFERSLSFGASQVGLLEARKALQSGDPVGAEAKLPKNETAIDALLLLVQARFEQRKAVEGKDIVALEAFAFEHGNGPMKPDFDRALAHASALGGDFEAAFAYASGKPDLEHDTWALLAQVGADSQLLNFAVGVDPAVSSALPATLRSTIAQRLVSAGLPNAAADWVQGAGVDMNIAAQVALANYDSRSALRLLSSGLQIADPNLLAMSYAALGNVDLAETTFRTAGRTAEADRLRRWTRQWPAPSGETRTPWEDVTALLDTAENTADAAPLRAGQARIEHSMRTRQTINALLAAVPMPDAPIQ